MASDLSAIFKAYDVRGIHPDQFDEDAAARIGRAFATWAGAPSILLGRDCRISSPALAAAFTDGERFAPLTVVADAANGMAGLVVPSLFERLPAKLVPLYMDLDGPFPT